MLKVVSSQPPKYGWKQADGVLALWNHDQVVWQWNYAAGLAKPYFHPVALTDGTVLTAPSPADHPWHRALWFSWKMLNGVNYWEENPATGKSDGVTEVRASKAVPHADSSARIEMSISYHPAGGACRIDGGPLDQRERSRRPGGLPHRLVRRIYGLREGCLAAGWNGRGRIRRAFRPHLPSIR